MPKAKRALPTWTKKEPTEKVHVYDARKKKVTQENKPKTAGVTRPFYDIKKVFKTN